MGARTLGAVTEQVHRHDVEEPRGSEALAEALHLQEVVRNRSAAPPAGKHRGKRRKGDVIDLDNKVVVKTKRRWVMIVLAVESVIAVIALLLGIIRRA